MAVAMAAAMVEAAAEGIVVANVVETAGEMEVAMVE
eukprot:gene7178-416_t